MEKQRNSSIELLRILSMCSVIGHHFLKCGGTGHLRIRFFRIYSVLVN